MINKIYTVVRNARSACARDMFGNNLSNQRSAGRPPTLEVEKLNSIRGNTASQ